MQISSRKFGLCLVASLLFAFASTGCEDDDFNDGVGDDLADEAIIEGQNRGADLMVITDQDLGNANQNVVLAVAAHILITIDQGEIFVAEEFFPDCDDEDACDYAENMIEEHDEHLTVTQGLAAALGVAPLDNRTSAALRADTDAIIQTLRATSLDVLDVEYMRSQVVMHEQALVLIEGLRIHVEEPTMDRFLADTAELIADHSAEAEQILRTELDPDVF